MEANKNTIVFQAMPRWDHPYASTAINLAKRLSQKNTLFYVERPFTWKDLLNINSANIKNRLKFWSGKPYHKPFSDYPNLVYIVPKPQLPINFLSEGKLYKWLNRKSAKSIWSTVNKVLDKFNISEFTYVNSFDPVRNYIDTDKTVLGKYYHCVDNIQGERYIAKHGIEAEKKAIQDATAVITTSKALKAKYSKFADKITVIENGVDFNHFDSQKDLPEPTEFAAVKGVKILYVGNIGLRIDYNFIEQAALKFPQWNWVLIGPKDQREFNGQKLLHFPNVHFLGKKSYNELPAYIHHADTCVLPFECNELTKCIYPLKINEYFACGKPVLSTRFADLKILEPQIHFYTGLTEFEQQLTNILNSHHTEDIIAKKSIALSNDWQEKTTCFEQIIINANESQKISLHYK